MNVLVRSVALLSLAILALTSTFAGISSAVDAASFQDTGTPVAADCESIAATFRDVVSANDNLADPELAIECGDGVVAVSSNGIPDYPYIATSPGDPQPQDLTFNIPIVPTEAADPGALPLLGPIAVAINGVPIYGPTEGTGGDVLSLEGALSACGSHHGPTGFHIHLFGWSSEVDCLFTGDEVESGTPIVVGWSVDGYPIMSGVVCADEACTTTQQLTSSWQLTDNSLFATDTWAAHSYVEGSGDLDECNGRVDSDGQYRYYTTTSFPYVLGCYHGTVAEGAIEGAAGGPRGR